MTLRSPAVVAACLVLLATSGEATAAPSACKTKTSDIGQAARCLLEAGRPAEAKRLLKRSLPLQPEPRPEHQLLLAAAYQALGNAAWVRRTLHRAVAEHPKDCQVRAWLAWYHLAQAELDEAGRLLGEPGCPTPAPKVRARYALLAATLQRHRQRRHAAAGNLDRALSQPSLFSEDRALLASLIRYALPHRNTPVRLRVDLGAGYSTNAMMSTPVDVGAISDSATGSLLSSLDVTVHIEPPWRWPVRPLLEGDLRSLLLLRRARGVPRASVAPFDYSYLSLSLRPGIAIGRRGPRVYYGGQLFLLAGDDGYQQGPRWFYETHRVEVEWEALAALSLWGGGGRSRFREQGRSRSEVDLGAGLLTNPWRDLRLLVGLSGRRHWARHRRYDLWGVTIIGSLTKPLGRFTARARVLASFDRYLRSAGLFDDGVATEQAARRDLLVKGAAELWSPSIGPMRFGIGYEITARASNADAYDYADQRVFGKLRISIETDPWLPAGEAGRRGHVRLPYGLGTDERLADERIQDLLRREDAARRGSSCLN